MAKHPIGWATPEDVAALCGVSRHTVRTWMKRGQIGTLCMVSSHVLLVRWVDAEERAVALHARRVA